MTSIGVFTAVAVLILTFVLAVVLKSVWRAKEGVRELLLRRRPPGEVLASTILSRVVRYSE